MTKGRTKRPRVGPWTRVSLARLGIAVDIRKQSQSQVINAGLACSIFVNVRTGKRRLFTSLLI
jgi:hypothetical protein